MKNKLTRIISMLLILAFLVSCFAVLASAETSGEGTEEEVETSVLLHRTYSEGWAYSNGVSPAEKKQKFAIEYEEASDFSYNYFLRIEAQDTCQDGYMEFRYKSSQPKEDGSVLMFDIKSDDYTDLGSVIYTRSIGGGNDGFTTGLAQIVKGKLQLPNVGVANDTAQNVITDLGNKWIRVAIVYNIGPKENNPADGYRICTGCYHKYAIADCTGGTCGRDYVDKYGTAQTGCKGKLDPAEMHQFISTRVYVGYAESFDVSTATALTTAESALATTVDLSKTTRYYDTSVCVRAGQTRGLDIIRFGLPNNSASQDKIDYATGQSWCLDNLKIYNGPENTVYTDEELAALGQGPGLMVNETASKTVEILTGSGQKSDAQYVNEALLLKVGVNYGLYARTRKPIMTDTASNLPYGAPVKLGGKVYVPFQAVLDYIGYPSYPHDDGLTYDFSTDKGSALLTVDRDTATVNGTLVPLTAAPMRVTDADTNAQYVVIAMDDVETLFSGYFVTYDEMGLIVIAEKDDVIHRDTDLTLMVDLMAEFIYDYRTGDEYYSMVKKNTNNFDHPYLFAKQEDFDTWHKVWKGEIDDPTLKKYLDAIVSETTNKNSSSSARIGDTYVKYYVGFDAWLADDKTVDSTGAGTYLMGQMVDNGDGSWINGAILNPHDTDLAKASSTYNGGYDWDGGRLNESGNYNTYIRLLAMSYQITRKEAYGRLAYEAAVKMGQWAHWGQGHFLNCADATRPYAMAYDWMYDTWLEWGYDLAPIEKAIADLGVYHGTLVSGIEGTPRCIRERRQGTSAYYTTMKNNWNAVCTSGIVVGALSILGIDYIQANETRTGTTKFDTATLATMVSNSKWILENNPKTLAKNGLGMYAPDGSYIESPNYWRYSTVSLFEMIWALNTATGDDMGFLNMWAMETTFYFAASIEFPSAIKTDTDKAQSAGYQFWNYHDSNQDYLDSCMFFYAAEQLGQEGLAAIRMQHLERKTVTIYDILGYKKEYAEISLEKAQQELGLTYVMESCDGVVSRDSWGDGCLYTGLMGNQNDASHAQIDSGNFIYANKNYIWFCDMGAENYNVYAYFSNDEYRYSYYRMTAEGANVVCLTSDQEVAPWGQVLDGGGDLIDYEYNEYGMKAIIDNTSAYGTLANEAKRGMLFTNDRKTVIVQDQIMFSGVQSVMWIGHTGADIKISSDGKVAHLIKTINGVEYAIRCTIVSPISSLAFKTLTADEFILTKTMKPGQSQELGGVAEKDRSKYQRLCIEATKRLSFECAVVIEFVENQYIMPEDYPVQYEWTNMNTWEIQKEFTATVVDESFIGNALLSDIKTYGDAANKLVVSGYAFNGRTSDFFIAMAKAAASVSVFKENMFKQVPELYEAYQTYVVNLAKYNSFKEDINTSVNNNMSIGVSLGGYMG